MSNELAGIEYHGNADGTAECLEAVERLLHYRGHFTRTQILTHRRAALGDHSLLMTNAIGDLIAIKSGFTSGYRGQGPRGFSKALSLLHWHEIELEEIEVEEALIHRLDQSSLTFRDLKRIASAAPVRPQRLWDYIFEEDELAPESRNPWHGRPEVIPMALIDSRISLLVRAFWNDPDGMLIKVHRRLESLVRERTKIGPDEASGASKLFAKAFAGDGARLSWPRLPKSERQGRAQLFIGTAMAYRNARLHQEDRKAEEHQLAELLLLNLLFKLEGEADLVVETDDD